MTPEQLTELQEYYANLLIYQYVSKPKAYATIKLLVNQMLCDGLFFLFPNAFNLDTAVGAQLTIIGNILGAPRNVYGLDLNHSFFNFTRFNGTPTSIGYNRYATLIDADLIGRWLSTATYVLNDFELRSLIQLKIIYNNTFSSFSQLKNALYATFQGDIDIVEPDNSLTFFNFTRYYLQPASVGFNRYNTLSDADYLERWSQSSLMKITYNVKQPYYSTMEVAQFLNIVPRSMGVSVVVNQI